MDELIHGVRIDKATERVDGDTFKVYLKVSEGHVSTDYTVTAKYDGNSPVCLQLKEIEADWGDNPDLKIKIIRLAKWAVQNLAICNIGNPIMNNHFFDVLGEIKNGKSQKNIKQKLGISDEDYDSIEKMLKNGGLIDDNSKITKLGKNMLDEKSRFENRD